MARYAPSCNFTGGKGDTFLRLDVSGIDALLEPIMHLNLPGADGRILQGRLRPV